MEDKIHFIDLTGTNDVVLIVVGFIGGLVSGFIGSGGAFVLTPAMMSMGVPGIVAVASNMAHKFPKALIGAYKRNKYGQVDIKLGIIMGIFAELGILTGKKFMVSIRDAYGRAGTDLYVSAVFVVVLAVVGGLVMRDALKMWKNEHHLEEKKHPTGKIIRFVRKIHIPGTMVYFKSIDARISLVILAPLGFATGLLAATIAVGGFIGVPALMYVVGLNAVMASATELVIAFVMGMGGSMMYAWDGFVDIRLSMLILLGSLFGIQLGAIGTTYVKDSMIKFVMGLIMLIVLFSRLLYIPGYLNTLSREGKIGRFHADDELVHWMDMSGQATLVLALTVGALIILGALINGILEHKKQHEILTPKDGIED